MTFTLVEKSKKIIIHFCLEACTNNKQGDSEYYVKQNKLLLYLRIIEKPSKHLKAGLHQHARETPFKKAMVA